MKIERLELRAFGPFTNYSLDFPIEGPGLHLIHGPNEAGKSTTLRALQALLFGFPHSISDDFEHKSTFLRVGATLVGPDGSKLSIVRRRATSKTIRAADDETVISDEQWKKMFNVSDKQRFWSVAACDPEDVRRGGEQLGQGGGDFQEILFEGAGLSRLPEIKKTLEDQAIKIYRPRAHDGLNAVLKAYKDKRVEARDAMVSTSIYSERLEEHEGNVAKLEMLKSEVSKLDQEVRRLERLQRSLPLLADRSDAAERLCSLGQVPRLSSDFSQRRIEAVQLAEIHKETIKIACELINKLANELGAIVVAEGLLAESAAIQALVASQTHLRKERNRCQSLEIDARTTRQSAEPLIAELAPGLGLDEVEKLRLSKTQITRIQALGRDRSAIFKSLEESEKQVTQASEAVVDASLQDRHETHRLLESVDSLLKTWSNEADPEKDRDKARASLLKRDAEAAKTLARLPRWSGSLDELMSRPVPDDSVIIELEERLTKTNTDYKLARKTLIENETEIEKLNAEALQEAIGGDAPSEEELLKARQQREEHWSFVRESWLGGQVDRSSSQLASEYERAVNQADVIADRLRREADRVANRAQRESKLILLKTQTLSLQQDVSEKLGEVTQAESGWKNAWSQTQIEPGSPKEMRVWVSTYQSLERQGEEIGHDRIAFNIAELKIAERKQSLMVFLNQLDASVSQQTDTLSVLMGRAQALIHEGELFRTLSGLERKRDVARAKCDEWLAQWAEAVLPMGLQGGSTPEAAEERLGKVNDLLKKRDAWLSQVQAIEQIQRQIEQFEQELQSVAGRAKFKGPTEDLLGSMSRSLIETQRADQRRQTLAEQLEAERKRLQVAEATVSQQTRIIELLCQEASCLRPEDLPAIEALADQARQLAKRISDAERQLLESGAGMSLAEIEAEATRIDRDEIASQLGSLSDDRSKRQSEIENLLTREGELKHELNSMEGPSIASDANQIAQTYVAQMESDVEEYARLKMASAILKLAIDRYHDRFQGPVLKRLPGLFRDLTRGSFAGVATDEEGKGKQVLVGVRPGTSREPVSIEGMSQGTRDSLYLAVRFATIEAYFDEREPMPFFADDILVHFDDDRAIAALRVLARIAERTQVLFFTHHQHLVDLASKALSESSWVLHTLPSRTNLALTV
jgi:uncharacterized protein YhaN